MSRLCFGTGTGGWSGRSEQTDLGERELADLLRYAFDRGITFWDSADQYGSHPHVARAPDGVDREDVTIVTKTCAEDASRTGKDIDRFLKELHTDYLDIVLLHCVDTADWPETRAGAMETLARKKQEGIIRAHGVSCHSFGALERAAQTPWAQIVLARINHAGQNMDDTPEKVVPVLERIAATGAGVYGMKVLACGSLGSAAGDAIDFVLGIPAVHAITVGMSSRREVDENIRQVEAYDGQS